MPLVEEAIWRRRLLVYSLVRFGGLAIFLFGVAVIYSNLLRPGGWPQLGAVISILGIIDAFFAPRLLRRAWNRQDQEQSLADSDDHPGERP